MTDGIYIIPNFSSDPTSESSSSSSSLELEPSSSLALLSTSMELLGGHFPLRPNPDFPCETAILLGFKISSACHTVQQLSCKCSGVFLQIGTDQYPHLHAVFFAHYDVRIGPQKGATVRKSSIYWMRCNFCTQGNSIVSVEKILPVSLPIYCFWK